MHRKILSIGSVIAVALMLGGGCGVDINSLGGGPVPVYDEPEPLAFTPEEALEILKFQKANPDLFDKIQGQSHAYRAIVRKHNEWARDTNRKRLEALGFSKEDAAKAFEKPPKEE